jgi:hypothetical protein
MKRGGVSKTDLSKWCDNLEKLFKNLETAFPRDNDLPYYKDKIMLARKVNPRMMVEQFMYIAKYFADEIMKKDTIFFTIIDEITTKDISFFDSLDPNKPENTKYLEIKALLQEQDGGLSTRYVQLLNKIRTLWEGMTNVSKDTIWKYLQIFITLGAIINKDQLTINTINKYRDLPLQV